MISPEKLFHFLVLVKPDGIIYTGRFRQMFLDAFLKAGELANIEFTKTLKDGETSKQNIFYHYNKPDDWLKKYGKKILIARNQLPEDSIIDHWSALQVGKSIPEALADYMTNGEMWAIVFSSTAENTFEIARKVLGDVDPSKADPKSIRGKYSKDSFYAAWTDENGPRAIRNVCHCSDSLLEAEREIRIFLGDEVANKFFPKEISLPIYSSPIYDACEEEEKKV